jgi:hypothetical protein
MGEHCVVGHVPAKTRRSVSERAADGCDQNSETNDKAAKRLVIPRWILKPAG